MQDGDILHELFSEMVFVGSNGHPSLQLQLKCDSACQLCLKQDQNVLEEIKCLMVSLPSR